MLLDRKSSVSKDELDGQSHDAEDDLGGPDNDELHNQADAEGGPEDDIEEHLQVNQQRVNLGLWPVCSTHSHCWLKRSRYVCKGSRVPA